MKPLRLLVLTCVTAAAAIAFAEGPPQGRPPHRPPPEAFEACAKAQTGAACTVHAPRGDVTGTCEETPEKKLACRPEHMPPAPPDQAPSQER